MPEPGRVSVLIPAFNEESSIASLVEKLRSLGEWHEILVVDDGSRDNTAQLAEEAGARVIRHPYNKGNGATVKTGSRVASGEFLLLMDADGQHDPGDIEKLLGALDTYDLAVGARLFRARASLSRGIGNAVLNRFASRLSGFPISDLTSGFRAANRQQFVEFLHLFPNGFSYPTTSTLAFIRAGYNVKFIPIEGKQRGDKSRSKMRPWREGFRFVMIILRMVALFSPMRVILPFCLALFLPGFAYMLYTIWTETHVTNSSLLLIIGAAVLFVFGLLSEQIATLRHGRNSDQ